MKSFRNIIKEEILKEVSFTLLNKFIPLLIDYVKHFGNKGKLESNSVSLKRYYEPYLEEAYKWASEKLDDVKRNGFPYFKHLFEVDVNNNVKINKRGLIYVERDIAFDVTEDLTIKDYKSIGECWSWKKGNGRDYCNDYGILNENIAVVKICGYVHPNSIDWLETVYLNSYDMKNETEIRMNNNALVEASYVKMFGQKYRLGGSYLINASADKYKKE